MIEIKSHKDLVRQISWFSDDEKRKVGCVIINENGEIVSYGSNTIPYKVSKTKSRVSKSNKYKWIGHAERNAISRAAKVGMSTNKCELYSNYYPCSDCAISIIDSGIKKIYAPKPDFNHERWGESWKTAKIMFKESGVDVEYIDFPM